VAKKTDLRRLTHNGLSRFRCQAVAQVQEGVPTMEARHSMGSSPWKRRDYFARIGNTRTVY